MSTEKYLKSILIFGMNFYSCLSSQKIFCWRPSGSSLQIIENRQNIYHELIQFSQLNNLTSGVTLPVFLIVNWFLDVTYRLFGNTNSIFLLSKTKYFCDLKFNWWNEVHQDSDSRSCSDQAHLKNIKIYKLSGVVEEKKRNLGIVFRKKKDSKILCVHWRENLETGEILGIFPKTYWKPQHQDL